VTKTKTEISTKKNSGFSTTCKKQRRRSIEKKEVEAEEVEELKKTKLHHQSGSGKKFQLLKEKWTTIFSEILLKELARRMENQHHPMPR